jgi:hypothetical protein
MKCIGYKIKIDCITLNYIIHIAAVNFPFKVVFKAFSIIVRHNYAELTG